MTSPDHLAGFASEFRPRRWLSNAHAQTIVGNFLPRRNEMPPPQERFFNIEEGVQVLCHCHWQPEERKQAALTVIIVHGLEGSSESRYVIGTGSKAWMRGWNVVRMNMRNCGGTEKFARTLYHSGLSGDVGAIARTLMEQDSLQRIAFVGYSMGGNLVLKLAAEWSADAPPQAIAFAGVSPALDLAPSADALHHPANRLYQWKFMRGLRNRFQRKAELFPQVYDAALSRGVKTIRQFDDVITAPYSGFLSAGDYYARASAGRLVDRIARPALVLHALDDPFIRFTEDTRARLESNPNITLIETEHGGHCAFLEPPNGYDGRWAEKTVVEFFARQLGEAPPAAGPGRRGK